MGSDERQLPAAGWYDDPDGRTGVRRYWDGSQWTDRYDESSGSSSRINEVNRDFRSLHTVASVFTVLGWLVAILGTLAVIGAAISAGSGNFETTDQFGRTTEVGSESVPLILIFGGLAVALYSLFFFAAAGITRLMLRVEDNTHRSALAIEKLEAAAALAGAQGSRAPG